MFQRALSPLPGSGDGGKSLTDLFDDYIFNNTDYTFAQANNSGTYSVSGLEVGKKYVCFFIATLSNASQNPTIGGVTIDKEFYFGLPSSKTALKMGGFYITVTSSNVTFYPRAIDGSFAYVFYEID